MTVITRRDFIKYAGIAGAVIFVGSRMGTGTLFKGNPAYAAVETLDFTITDAIKEMVTHNSINTAECYFWVYKSNTPAYSPECPGPCIVAHHGDIINITVHNDLDEPHTLSCPTLGVTSAPINPGESATISITANVLGAHMYYDHLNAPVNRVMGLHGSIMVLPVEADRNGTHKLTPYSNASDQLAATHGVQRLYDDFGSAHFPGLAWEEGDSTTWALYDSEMDGETPIVNCSPFRQYCWLLSQASPRLFAEVGNYTAGQNYPAGEFLNKFLKGDFVLNNNQNAHSDGILSVSYLPQYFLINGQSGMMSHFNPTVTPQGRVGEPVVVHIMNAGLWTHSMHLHANHMWITSVNGAVNPNPIWVDVYRVDPMTRVDYTVPFMRPPDVGHPSGIGLPETPLMTDNGHPLWPPVEEMNMYMPPLGTKAKAPPGDPLGRTEVELGQRMSPLCYPMHDHSEPSQTSQGGNYNTGLISGIYFTGDRNGTMDFPMDEDFHMAFHNIRGCSPGVERAAPPLGEVPHPH